MEKRAFSIFLIAMLGGTVYFYNDNALYSLLCLTLFIIGAYSARAT